MDGKPVTEHVPHDDEVRVLVVDSNTVHTEELREQRDAVTLYNVLEAHTFMSIKYLYSTGTVLTHLNQVHALITEPNHNSCTN